MRGSWKGLFYLKEGKKCNFLICKKSAKFFKSRNKATYFSPNLLVKKALQTQLVSIRLTQYFIRWIKNSKILANHQ